MTGLIILAAGESSRLGTPKQILKFEGKSLIKHTVEVALSSVCSPVIVVLGAYHEDILSEIENEKVQIVYNKNWQQGMASSIHAGIKALENINDLNSVVIMLCDQPFVTGRLIDSLVNEFSRGSAQIIASAYGNTLGVPVLFSSSLFPELLQVQGQEGAKKLINSFKADVVRIDFPEGVVDIDTPADYEKLKSKKFPS
jgi:molybdenum cofactor cytidylyltransferase